MAHKGGYSFSLSALGVTVFGGPEIETSENGIGPIDADISPGKGGELTTRTDDDTAQLTMDSEAHGFVGPVGTTPGEVVDVHWSGGSRYGMDVTAVAGDLVTVDGGTGWALPVGPVGSTAGTTVVVMEPEEFDLLNFDPDDLTLIGFGGSQQFRATFYTTGDAVRLSVHRIANDGYGWASGRDINNPLSGSNLATLKVSNGSSTTACRFKLTGLRE